MTTLLAFTPVDIFVSVATALFTIIGTGFISIIGWKVFGKGAWSTITEFFDHVKGVDTNLRELVTHAKSVDTRLDRHDGILDDHGRQLAYLRGHEDAKREIAANARTLGQVIEQATRQEEPPL